MWQAWNIVLFPVFSVAFQVFQERSFNDLCLFSTDPEQTSEAFTNLHRELNYTQVETVTNWIKVNWINKCF